VSGGQESGPAQPAARAKRSRLAYLDWARGFAALIMIQGHVFHSFTQNDLRNTSVYMLSQFVGGMPPAIFLFLTGVTYGFLMFSLERQGHGNRERLVGSLKRAGYLFLLAYAFRAQLWLFGLPHSQWTDLLKVDILNCMGMAMAVLAPLAIVPSVDRIRLSLASGLLIAMASPVISGLSFAGFPDLFRMYFKPDYSFFTFFPWASFLAFGISFGTVLRIAKPEKVERVIEWGALLGFGLVMSGQFFGNLDMSLYTKSEYWLDSPALVSVKLGVVLLLLAISFVWTEYGLHGRKSWVAIFGTHSLFVYWVHTELVYGRWLWMFKESLPLDLTAVVAAAVMLLMGVLLYTMRRRVWKEA
jgi:uncharacterized membrane protein